ncbi:MAG: hypothetical protein U1F60_06055 [Planctomycetota bacterium]
MRTPTFAVSFLFALLAFGCTAKVESTSPTDAAAQAAIEAVAKANPEIVRLTVHMQPAGGSGPIAVASTAADRLGKPSDKEDVQAMQSGQPVVLDEKDAMDVTVPAMQKDGKWTAAIGVTLKAPAGADKEALKKKAAEIASGIEKTLATKK